MNAEQDERQEMTQDAEIDVSANNSSGAQNEADGCMPAEPNGMQLPASADDGPVSKQDDPSTESLASARAATPEPASAPEKEGSSASGASSGQQTLSEAGGPQGHDVVSEASSAPEFASPGQSSSPEPAAPAPRKKRWLKVLAIACACVAVLVAIGVTAYFSLTTTMPDLAGADAQEAVSELQGLSSSWNITVYDENGESLDADEVPALENCEIKAYTPEEGTRLNKLDASEAVSVVVGKREKMTEAEREEAIAYAEEHMADYAELLHHTSLTGLVQDGYVAFAIANENGSFMSAGGQPIIWSSGDSEEATGTEFLYEDSIHSWASSQASTMGLNVVLAEYTSDGYLIQVFVVPHVDSTTAEWEAAQKAAENLVAGAQAYVQEHQDETLEKVLSYYRSVQSDAEVEGFMQEDTARVFISQSGSGYHWLGDAVEVAQSRNSETEAAKWAACCLGASVSIEYYEDGNVMWDSFTAEPSDVDRIHVCDAVS